MYRVADTSGMRVPVTSGTVTRRFRPENTPERLRAFRAVLLAAAVLLGITAMVVLLEVHSTAVSVRDTAAPAYLDVLEARAVLSDADRAVWQSLRSGEAQFLGPGQHYEDDITLADQDLQRVAALAGPGSSGTLQALTGLLVTYQGLVEQADAAYRADTALGPASNHDLASAYLVYAGQSLQGQRQPDGSVQGGLFPTMSKLSYANQQALDNKFSSLWANPAMLAAFATVGVVVLGSLVALQVFLRRRFRRRMSPPLLLAGALVCGLLAWMGAVIVPAESAFAAARNTARPRLVQIWQYQTQAVDAQARMLQTSAAGNTAGAAGELNLPAIQPASDRFDADLVSAENTDGLPIGIPIAALVIAGLVFVAIKPRLDEYRG
jgi:hypothetical protein